MVSGPKFSTIFRVRVRVRLIMVCDVTLVCITKLGCDLTLVYVQRYIQCDKFHPPRNLARLAFLIIRMAKVNW